MSTTSISALNSALVARQQAGAARPRPWLSSSKVTPSSSSSTRFGPRGQASRIPRRPTPSSVSALPPKRTTTTTVTARSTAPVSSGQTLSSSASFSAASSSLLARAVARASRDRPWHAQSIKPAAPAIIKSDLIAAPSAAPAVIKPHTTAAWVRSQAIDLRHALLRSSPPKRLNSWLMNQAISPPGVLPSISVPSTWGRKSSLNYPGLRPHASAMPQPSQSRITSSAWGRKSSAKHPRLTLRQAFAIVSSQPSSPASPPAPVSYLEQAYKPDPYIAAIAANVLERFDPQPFRDANERLLKSMDGARRAYISLLETERDLGAQDQAQDQDQDQDQDQASQDQDPTPPTRKTVTFNDKPEVIMVPKWIGVDQPKGEHVSAAMRFLGTLRAWTSTESDPTSYHTTWSTWTDDSQFDHSDCPNPTCHFRAKDLYMLEANYEEWTPPVWTDASNVD